LRLGTLEGAVDAPAGKRGNGNVVLGNDARRRPHFPGYAAAAIRVHHDALEFPDGEIVKLTR
jgi:hypothetical protein